jgi:hypothetical protein
MLINSLNELKRQSLFEQTQLNRHPLLTVQLMQLCPVDKTRDLPDGLPIRRANYRAPPMLCI